MNDQRFDNIPNHYTVEDEYGRFEINFLPTEEELDEMERIVSEMPQIDMKELQKQQPLPTIPTPFGEVEINPDEVTDPCRREISDDDVILQILEESENKAYPYPDYDPELGF